MTSIDTMNSDLQDLFSRYEHKKGNTIIVLQEIQDLYKHLPEDALEKMAEFYHMPLSEIYGVATFYSQFKFNKPGRYQIKVCNGTACHINGAVAITRAIENTLEISDGMTTGDHLFSLDNVACLGCCSLAPVIMINERVFGNLDEKSVKKILNEYKKGG